MSPPQFSVIFLAGGRGSRMAADTPKQFLPLHGKLVAFHSLEVFLKMPEAAEVIVVCDPSFQHHFSDYPSLKWAAPGKRRQDSVYNGLQQVLPQAEYICIHDGCRPFIDHAMVAQVFAAAQECGAAAAGMPLRFTVKEVSPTGHVASTPNRDYFWEVQTPQILHRNVLQQGFAKAHSENATVTDDTSLAELIGHPVKLVKGAYTNLKITTPDDMAVAHSILKDI